MQKKMSGMLAFIIHFCIFFLIIGSSRFTSQLPLLDFSKLVSADYFKIKELSVIIITPRFVFVLGNAIVIVLVLLKSAGNNSLADKDDDINGSVMSSDHNLGFSDHHIIKEHGRNNQCVYNQSVRDNKIRRISQSYYDNMPRLHRLNETATGKELRRPPATFTCRKTDVAATNQMSNDEFRRRVEAFIARQQRSLREEEFSSLLVSCES